MNKDLELLTRVIDEKSAKILDANDKIWEYAELAFHETRSAALSWEFSESTMHSHP